MAGAFCGGVDERCHVPLRKNKSFGTSRTNWVMETKGTSRLAELRCFWRLIFHHRRGQQSGRETKDARPPSPVCAALASALLAIIRTNINQTLEVKSQRTDTNMGFQASPGTLRHALLRALARDRYRVI